MPHIWIVEKETRVVTNRTGSKRVATKHAFEIVPHTRQGSVPLPPGKERDGKRMMQKPVCGADAEAWSNAYGIDRSEMCWACKQAIKVSKDRKKMAQMRLF